MLPFGRESKLDIIKKVSYIKRKLITVAAAAMTLCVSLLAGCERGEEPSAPAFSYIYDPGENSLGAISSSSASPNASASPDTSANPDTSASATDSSSGGTPAPVWLPEELEAGTFYFSKDPGNPVTVMFGDNTITVVAEGGAVTGVQQGSPAMSVSREISAGVTTYTLTPKSEYLSGKYGYFCTIDKNNYLGEVWFAIKDGKIAVPEFQKLAENNKNVLDSVVDSSAERVAQAMTMDGSVDNIPEIWAEIEKISNEICDGIDDDYEKLRAIADWVSDNIYYDRPAVARGEPPSCLTLEYILNNKSGICGSYANMTAALCSAQGIRCISVTGKALINKQNYLNTSLEGELHEWNVAEINGRQIIVDSCWMSANNLSYGGIYTHKNNVWKWFDVGDEIFAVDHQAKTAEYKDFKTVAENIANQRG